MGMKEVQLSKFDLGEIVHESIELLKPQVIHKNLEFRHDNRQGYEITADRERLSFIVRNILMNAIKFTPEGGKVTIDYPSASEIRITDTGSGISHEILATLFSDRVSSREGTNGESGAGIGLMLSQEFAESIGAKILVESEVGVGTVFRIVLKEEI
jgi:signal transduction histidine kinase